MLLLLWLGMLEADECDGRRDEADEVDDTGRERAALPLPLALVLELLLMLLPLLLWLLLLWKLLLV